MRRLLKRTIERALVASPLTTLSRARRRGRTIVLAYHGVTPHGARARGDASLHLPQRELARQLDALMETHDVVPLASLASLGSNDAEATRPRAAITFDDAYAGALEAGIEELARRGLPATIFVAPGLLGGVTWWDLLAGDDGVVAERVRRHALERLAGKGTEILRWAAEQGIRRTMESEVPRIATEEELTRVAPTPGITLGAHGWSHANLAALGDSELAPELVRPLTWLRERFPDVSIPWVAYPYGAFSSAVEGAAARAGYVGALRVDGGWTGDDRPHARPRFNVPAGLSLDGFRLRISGIGA